ncbi:hypothetical protein [Sphingomonas alba]|uniref:Colicin transporter n=1 Tax=Sphingomonas alba TaxID=2908208 RepID=A0ABT0RLM0_9SPHN|nr:hypothetical protein [Sphingomonas alba]MCL6683523.1 hypothetical protein [Sphingomonas alba]
MIPIPNRLAPKLIVGIGCVLLLALLVHDRNRWKAKTENYAEMLAGERAAHAATVANVRAAAEQARALDAANAARVKAEQAAINERTENEFEDRIAAARAAAGGLRALSPAASDSRNGGTAPVPGLSIAAKRVAQDTEEGGLPQPDQLTATEQAIQLDELIKWVRAQAAVAPSKD